MLSKRATIIIIYNRLLGFQRLNLALGEISAEDQVIIVGYMPKRQQKNLHQLFYKHKIIFTNKSVHSKDIIRTLILASTEESIIITDTRCSLTAKQIEGFKLIIDENPDKLIEADLSSLNNQDDFESAKRVERIFLTADCTPFYFRPVAGLGYSKKLLQKLNQIIDHNPLDKKQPEDLPLTDYPRLILKLKRINKCVLPFNTSLGYDYAANRPALIAKAVKNGFQMESLAKKYPAIGADSNAKLVNLRNILQTGIAHKSNFEKIIFFSWIIGIMSKKIIYRAMSHHFFTLIFKELRHKLKNAGIIKWQTDRQALEIELTSYCDVNCFNCNRNIPQAPASEHISLEQIRKFVSESIDLKYPWKKIVIMGGEPTLHPQLYEIIEEFEKLHLFDRKIIFYLITNGYGEKSKIAIDRLPDWIIIVNSNKKSRINNFYAINSAAEDCGKKINPSSACEYTERCGMAFSRYGFFYCGIGASIARVFGIDIGIRSLKTVQNNSGELWRQRKKLCRYCGAMVDRKFKHTFTKEIMTPTWIKACDKYKLNKPTITQY